MAASRSAANGCVATTRKWSSCTRSRFTARPLLVIATVLVFGGLFGAAMGALIHYFKLQPFIVTLSGMFLARGLCYLISIESITIDDPLYVAMSQTRLEFWGAFISPSVVIALVTLAVAIFIAHYTRFGRAVYAIGGNEQSALMMGLPVGRSKVLVYASLIARSS